jgi:hypothetical protein
MVDRWASDAHAIRDSERTMADPLDQEVAKLVERVREDPQASLRHRAID